MTENFKENTKIFQTEIKRIRKETSGKVERVKVKDDTLLVERKRSWADYHCSCQGVCEMAWQTSFQGIKAGIGLNTTTTIVTSTILSVSNSLPFRHYHLQVHVMKFSHGHHENRTTQPSLPLWSMASVAAKSDGTGLMFTAILMVAMTMALTHSLAFTITDITSSFHHTHSPHAHIQKHRHTCTQKTATF